MGRGKHLDGCVENAAVCSGEWGSGGYSLRGDLVFEVSREMIIAKTF